tara:strand:- start:41 stop:238 length:198 start_codon:yes stop_codon:yes gene_type:complete
MGIKETSTKLSDVIKLSIAMAQELQEMIDEAEKAGCKNPMPATKALLDEWEAYYQEQQLIDEVMA